MDTDADKPPSGTMEDTFTLQVLSQSVGVNGPLTLPDLPVTTTVAELKSKIRDKLLPASADEARQRLIYRGRLLIRSDETMRELFGNETVSDATHALNSFAATNTMVAQEPSRAVATFSSTTSGRSYDSIEPTISERALPSHNPDRFCCTRPWITQLSHAEQVICANHASKHRRVCRRWQQHKTTCLHSLVARRTSGYSHHRLCNISYSTHRHSSRQC